MITQKKIGIVTLHGYSNYGNKLQNYALKYTIEKLGYLVDTTIISDSKLSKKMRIKYFLKNFFKKPIKSLLKVINTIRKTNNTYDETLIEQTSREIIFKNFSSEYLSEVFLDLTTSNQTSNISNYTSFIVGSDQVWNPSSYIMLPIYFLTFAESNKRIAYAPSISRSELPKEYKKDYKSWLEGMSAISVREKAGANIIQELIGQNVPVLVDPTMLLNKEEWLVISKRASNRPDTAYLLTYFLGGPTDDTRKKLEKLAKEKNMTIINLGDITERETYETGPSEFLDYINNASAFFTDSFHGVVFSIIFQTPFVVYERQSSGPSMYSRIKTILDNFNMRNREANGFNEDIFSMDFSGTQKVLEREYNKSINYLKEALRIEE